MNPRGTLGTSASIRISVTAAVEIRNTKIIIIVTIFLLLLL